MVCQTQGANLTALVLIRFQCYSKLEPGLDLCYQIVPRRFFFVILFTYVGHVPLLLNDLVHVLSYIIAQYDHHSYRHLHVALKNDTNHVVVFFYLTEYMYFQTICIIKYGKNTRLCVSTHFITRRFSTGIQLWLS